MPQMAPLNWLSLFMYFTLIMIMINPLNYFLCLKTKLSSTYKNSPQPFNWKW